MAEGLKEGQGMPQGGEVQAVEELQRAWADLRGRLERVEKAEREGRRHRELAQENRGTEKRKIRNELRDALTKIQGASKEQRHCLERVEYSPNQARLAHLTHAERLATVESQLRDEAKGRRSEMQRRQGANEQTDEWMKLVETKVERVLARPPSVPLKHMWVPDGAVREEVKEALMDAKRHSEGARKTGGPTRIAGSHRAKTATKAMDVMQELKILVHNMHPKSRDMASWSAAMRDTANVVKGQNEAFQNTVTEVATKIKMAMGSMEAQVEPSRTNVGPPKTGFVQVDQELQAEMDQAMKLMKQRTAALDAIVRKMHVDMKTTPSDMRNVQANATNKLEAIHKSKDDMAAKVEEMQQLHIDITKYVEKESREDGM